MSVAHLALNIVSQLLEELKTENPEKRDELIKLVYNKLHTCPNSEPTQLWIQNITHETDDWGGDDLYTMPLCKLVARRPVQLWNNDWLKPEIVSGFPVDSIVDWELLKETGSKINIQFNPYNDYTGF